MWIFSCGDPEKRIWLRPGERYVFGRVRPSNTDRPAVNIEIPAERMLSRTHLIVNVSPVGEGDGINIKRRSKVTLQDPGSKHGTRVDGVEIRGKEFPLADNKNSFTIVLGKMTKPYRLQWVPIILSFNIPSKERNNKFFLAPFRNKLEQFDIKTIPVWVPGSTHVVATKRNTPIGLQGLICGAHIVTSDYVDAIVAQTKRLPIPENSLEIPRCPLEIDFDDFFPDPMEYLPPPANEPTNLPAEMYRPDPKRRRMFEGWTFMFFGERQCRALLGPIVDGHGKTEVYDMTWGKTTPQEFVSHVRQRGRDVALIRPISIPEELKDWTEEFIAEVESILGYRMVIQNELLEVILTRDLAKLKPPEEIDDLRSTAFPTSTAALRSTATRAAQRPRPEEPSQADIPSSIPETQAALTAIPSRRPRPRRKIATGPFSFDLGGDVLPPPTPAPEAQPQPASTTTSAFFTPVLAPIMSSPPETQTQPPIPSSPPPKSPHKRSAPTDFDDSLDIMSLLPAAQHVKRRKLDEAATSNPPSLTQVPASPSPPPPSPQPVKKKPPKKPLTPEEELARKTELIRRDRDAKDATMDAAERRNGSAEGEVEMLRDLAIVEVAPLVVRRGRAGMAQSSGKESWRKEWEGRPNYKRFRRRGAEDGGGGGSMNSVQSTSASASGSGRLIIGMVEYRPEEEEDEDGEDYFLKSRSPSVSVSASASVSRSAYTTARELSPTPAPNTTPHPRAAPSPAPALSASLKRTATSRVASQSPVKRQRRMKLKVEESDEEVGGDGDGDGGGVEEGGGEDGAGVRFRWRSRGRR